MPQVREKMGFGGWGGMLAEFEPGNGQPPALSRIRQSFLLHHHIQTHLRLVTGLFGVAMVGGPGFGATLFLP